MFHHGHGRSKAQAAEESEALSVNNSGSESRGQNKGYVVIAVVYLLGLIMGALDMSIVNPARTVIQNNMSVDDSIGVWILTIYTLAYAASIPVMGKLADRHGRKSIYLVCILMFGIGSLMCGLSRSVGSFEMLLIARVIQALGGGGIMPVATAEFGTAFPEEKRGMALGMVGMVYGLASIFGPSVGSGILDIFGQTEWQFIFYVNVPICIVVVVLGIIKLPNHKADDVKPIDGLGILLLTCMTLSLMYGLKNIDFYDFSSIGNTDVWPFLVVFVVLLPLFILREKRAIDPIISLRYFTSRNIVITLICAVISGIIMMGTIFFPQFCENAMFMKSGSGGYFIALLGLGSAVGAMGSGGMIDKFGVKPVLAIGFIGAVVGCLFMAFVACSYPSLLTVCVTMLLSGLGMGFTMGTPLNYMMLENTDDSEANSALATMSLVRSIGTAVAPAIMVAFIVHASAGLQDSLMNQLPTEVEVSPLPHAAELDKKLADLRADEDTADMLEGIDIPELSSYNKVEVNMSESDGTYDVEVSDEMLTKLQDSDVTTIVPVMKEMTSEMFGQIKPQLVEDVTGGISSGIKTMEEKSVEMSDAIAEMVDGIAEMDQGYDELTSGIAEMDGNIANATAQIAEFESQITQMNDGIAELTTGIEGLTEGIAALKPQIEQMSAMMGADAPAVVAMQAKLDEMVSSKAEVEATVTQMQEGLAGITAARDGVMQGRTGMTQGREEMVAAQQEMASGRADLVAARDELQTAYDSMLETIQQLGEVKEAVPGLFNEAEENYLIAIDEKADDIQSTYQQTLNAGFHDMGVFVAIVAAIGLIVLLPYRDVRRKKDEGEGEADGAVDGEAVQAEGAVEAEVVAVTEVAAEA